MNGFATALLAGMVVKHPANRTTDKTAAKPHYVGALLHLLYGDMRPRWAGDKRRPGVESIVARAHAISTND